MVYQWKYGISGVSAQKAGEYFKSLESRDGEIKPFTIVDEAKPTDALLHPAFEWDDTSAAEKYRENQAKSIIRNIVVVQEKPASSPVITRAIVNVAPCEEEHPNESGHYVTVETAMRDSDMKSTLFQHALAELNMFKAKYREMSEFSKLFKEIDRLGK